MAKCRRSLPIIRGSLVLLLLLLLQALSQTDAAPEKAVAKVPYCDCDYHYWPGGCAISTPAPRGFKCYCRFLGFWSCSGITYTCSDEEYCPGGRASYCACVLGTGNCSGYSQRSKELSKCKIANKISSAVEAYGALEMPEDETPVCDCDYYPGGCLISTPAPKGYKCVCTYAGAWTCNGWPEGCSEGEYCPAGGYDYCDCLRGGGDCGAYLKHDTKKQCDFDRPHGDSCDCNKDSDWTKGQYTIESVDFDQSHTSKKNADTAPVGSAVDIPNASGAAQKHSIDVKKTFSSASKFQRTHGISIEVGVSFNVHIPLINEETHVDVGSEKSFTWGSENTVSHEYRHRFTCTSPPKQHVRCQAYLTSFDVEVPYVMTLKHNNIPDCTCQSKGVWKGKGSYTSSLASQTVGICTALDSFGRCVE